MDEISKVLGRREIVDEQEVRKIKQMEKIYSEIKSEFQENLEKIKDSNLLYNNPESTVMLREHSRSSDQKPGTLQEELMENVEIENVIEQQDLVNERQKHMQEIDRAINVINTMSSQILHLTINDGQKLDSIMKKHKEHQATVEKKINPELERANVVSQRHMRQTCCYGLMAVLLAVCVIGVLYLMFDKKKPENATLLLKY